ncbi:3D domain-containing protein [Lysinibacillus sp. BPa_S21]|uniref:3D domain-containing protein n=1 Tax=Lysinibacillus sp. BPa_S21 TaxID=2932478 RepID=UPI0020132F7F|nr:3D domain-containing protein [Lysinibacillus sp. BPa_S21]MCL1696414.1 3D domain-containing protein [Lysinibacillus sp. BPa_S21]
MNKLTKSLTVPTLITCTFGWAWFASHVVDESNKDGTPESSDVIKRMEKIKKNSFAYQIESFHKECERLKEEERKKLERQRIEKERQVKLEQERLARIEKERELAEARRIEEAKKAEQIRLAQAEKRKKQQTKSRESNESVNSNWMTFNGSYYGADCYQCSGITATGINVKNTIYYNGYRIIALDPNTIPLWSIVEVKTPNESFKAVVGDTGGRIKGFNADILVESEARASQLGRHNIQIRVIGSLK